MPDPSTVQCWGQAPHKTMEGLIYQAIEEKKSIQNNRYIVIPFNLEEEGYILSMSCFDDIFEEEDKLLAETLIQSTIERFLEGESK